MTRLCERSDFPELIQLTADELGINAAIVEKDYYVTEALRIVADRFGDEVLFKGGTSLSKGWKLIERFSEDIDLYVRPGRNDRATDRRLKGIALAVGEHPALTRDEPRRHVSGGFGRDEYYSYDARAGVFAGIEATVKLEAGIQSGDYPVEERPLQSLIGELLDQQRVDSGAVDQAAFPMRLLHFRRTCVEKLFTLHDRVERLVRRDGQALGAYARHYYDVYRLLQSEEVRGTLNSDDYVGVAADYRRLASRYYPDQVLPRDMELRHSPALFPDAELRARLEVSYRDQSSRLCYGQAPAFQQVLDALEEIRGRLIGVPSEGTG